MIVDFKPLRHRLEDELERLVERLDTDCQAVGRRQDGNSQKSDDEAALECLDSWERIALEKQLRAQIAEIEHALRKFEEGTYGLCDICGKPIVPERLEALLWASLCVSCKTRQVKVTGSRGFWSPEHMSDPR